MKSLAKKSLFMQAQQRGFAATVTINMPKFELHKLDEAQMPTKATATKRQLRGLRVHLAHQAAADGLLHPHVTYEKN